MIQARPPRVEVPKTSALSLAGRLQFTSKMMLHNVMRATEITSVRDNSLHTHQDRFLVYTQPVRIKTVSVLFQGYRFNTLCSLFPVILHSSHQNWLILPVKMNIYDSVGGETPLEWIEPIRKQVCIVVHTVCVGTWLDYYGRRLLTESEGQPSVGLIPWTSQCCHSLSFTSAGVKVDIPTKK